MWLKVGIPVVIVAVMIALRVGYYLVWRKHWDRRPAKDRKGPEEEVVIIRGDGAPSAPAENRSHLASDGERGRT